MRFRPPAASGRWAPHLAAIVLFAVLCGAATYWGLQLLAPRAAIAPAGSLVDWQKAPDLAAASRLFGMPPSAVQAQRAAVVASNIKVIGVAASPTRGSAVLAIDGKPPKAFLVGEKIDDRSTLFEVRADAVVIEQPSGRVELLAPERPDPALLSAGPAAQSGAVPPAPVPIAPRPGSAPPPGTQQALPRIGPSPAPAPVPPAPPPAAGATQDAPSAGEPPADTTQPGTAPPPADPANETSPAAEPRARRGGPVVHAVERRTAALRQ